MITTLLANIASLVGVGSLSLARGATESFPTASSRQSGRGVAADAPPARRPPPLDAVIDQRYRAATERLLAIARLTVAAVLFGAVATNTGPLHPPIVKALMGAYILHAVAVLAVIARRADSRMVEGWLLHVVDIGAATVVTTLSGGASSHLVPLFAFVLIAAAFRWGYRVTLLQGGLVAGIITLETIPALAGITPWAFEPDTFVVWIFYNGLLAVLFGLLSERMHALSFQAAALGQVMARVGQASGLASAIRATLSELLRLFSATRAQLILLEANTSELFLYRAEFVGSTVRVWGGAVPRDTRQQRLFPIPPGISAFELRRRDGEGVPSVVLAMDQSGLVTNTRFEVPATILEPWDWREAIGAAVDVRRGWQGRVYLVDPRATPAGQIRLGWLRNLSQQIAPLLLDLYLLRNLRSRAESHERARISRELHDGVIQSLAAIEMRLEEARRHAERLSPALASDLLESQRLLHEEAVRTRELMMLLRPVDVEVRQLPAQLRDVVERFARTTAIDAHLDWVAGPIDLSPRECGEITLLLQEALINVRRHSGASAVMVRVAADARRWRLIVEDNGHGFGFEGHFTHEQLNGQPNAPRVIRERVGAAGGTLTIASSGSGARLEMEFPVAAGGVVS